MEATAVRQAIHALIERKEKRIEELRESTTTELAPYNRMLNEHTISCIGNGIDTLIELEHTLRLCDCPPEAYKEESKK